MRPDLIVIGVLVLAMAIPLFILIQAMWSAPRGGLYRPAPWPPPPKTMADLKEPIPKMPGVVALSAGEMIVPGPPRKGGRGAAVCSYCGRSHEGIQAASCPGCGAQIVRAGREVGVQRFESFAGARVTEIRRERHRVWNEQTMQWETVTATFSKPKR